MDRNDRRLMRGLAVTAAWVFAAWGLQFVLEATVFERVLANLVEATAPAVAWVLDHPRLSVVTPLAPAVVQSLAADLA